jgi:hypothetical protein
MVGEVTKTNKEDKDKDVGEPCDKIGAVFDEDSEEEEETETSANTNEVGRPGVDEILNVLLDTVNA